MFFYIITGVTLICGGLYIFKPRIFYKGVLNVSLSLIKSVLWLKQLKQQLLDEKTDLVFKRKIKTDKNYVYEFEYKNIDKEKNYTHKYTLKYILDEDLKDKENLIKKEIEKKVKNKGIEELNNNTNKILHCSFYWDNDPETIYDLTSDLRHFVLHFDCENTTIDKFINYIEYLNNNNLKLYLQDKDNCGLSIIKNDDLFSEIKITIKEASNKSFKEILN